MMGGAHVSFGGYMERLDVHILEGAREGEREGNITITVPMREYVDDDVIGSS